MAGSGRPSLYPVLDLNNVDTREKHYTQLLDLWNGGIGILLAKSERNRTAREEAMLEQLTVCVELLKKAMTGPNSGYEEEFYKKIIDALPRNALEITD